jgi:hypothetical protein
MYSAGKGFGAFFGFAGSSAAGLASSTTFDGMFSGIELPVSRP